MKATFNNIALMGIATAIPKNKFDLTTLASQFGENEMKRIIASTGIQSVRVGHPNMKASDLCMSAAQKLITTNHIDIKSIDAVIFVSQTPDTIMPATSTQIQYRLGLGTETVAFDINYGCSGYVYGLYQAAMLISSGGCKRVLLCAGDVITPYLNPLDHQVRMVFGDAGSATLIEEGSGTVSFILKTDGSGGRHLQIDNKQDHKRFLHMDGAEIMAFALREVPLIIQELLNINNWQMQDVDIFALHQANAFMLNYLRKKMQLKKEVVPIAVGDVGNTGPASIPLMLSMKFPDKNRDNKLNKVVMCGFGVGLSWAAASLNLSNTVILDPAEID